MSTDSPAPTPPPTPREASSTTLVPGVPVRFSLRTLLVAMTLFAIWCGFVSVLPRAFSQVAIGVVWLAAAGWLITGIVFGKGDQRAFCIGAAVVVSSMWTSLGGRFIEGMTTLIGVRFFSMGSSFHGELWLDLFLLAAAAVANGWFCVWARRFFERPSGG